VSTLATALAAAAALAGLAALRTASKSKNSTPPPSPRPKVARARGAYPGDFAGSVAIHYAPSINGRPDPGEIVWTWVPYEEDFAQGKDRPVLLIGRDGEWLLGLFLTSKDHDRDARAEARWGRHWMDLGKGPWDPHGRPSEIRLDRVVRVDPAQVRREGSILDASRFDAVIRAARAANHW
jgi:hypothetical protein